MEVNRGDNAGTQSLRMVLHGPFEQLKVELDRYEEELSTRGASLESRITSYVYPVARFLRYLDEPYVPIAAAPSRPPFQSRASDDPVMRGGRGRGPAVHRGASRYDGLGCTCLNILSQGSA